MTLSRIRSTRRSLASRCSGVRQRSASMSRVRRAEGCSSSCSNSFTLEYALHHNDPTSQDNCINAINRFKYRNDMCEENKVNTHAMICSVKAHLTAQKIDLTAFF